MNQKNRKLPEDLKRIFDEIDSMSNYFKENEVMKQKKDEKKSKRTDYFKEVWTNEGVNVWEKK